MQYRIKQEVGVRLVDSAEAYEEIQRLRAEAYSASGKAVPTLSYEQTSAFGDAKVFGFFHGGRCIASFMLRIPGPDALLESVDLPLGHYPKSLPRKEHAIEVSKLCVQRNYRRTDVLKKMFEQVHRELVLAGRASIVICCEDRLLGLYRGIGFRLTGYEFRKEDGKRFQILVTTQKRFGIYGAHVGPWRWNLFLAEVTVEMLKHREISARPLSLLLWSVYGFFGPLSVLLENRKVSR